jgi:ubiquinone/menaquinone biosynthesis C-methylase UbiE
MKEKTFWDSFIGLYQMGPAKHRTYLLDKMKSLGITGFLDVGCGTGPLYDLIKNTLNLEDGMSLRWNLGYKGTDYSWKMIEIAKQHFPEGNFEVQDARKLSETDTSWDAVVLMHCLDHLDDYQAAIREATRVAKKYVVIILWRDFVGAGTHLNDKNMMNKNEGEEPWEDTHLQEYSRESLQVEFDKNNLKVIEETSGEVINDPGKYNFIYWLEKNAE